MLPLSERVFGLSYADKASARGTNNVQTMAKFIRLPIRPEPTKETSSQAAVKLTDARNEELEARLQASSRKKRKALTPRNTPKTTSQTECNGSPYSKHTRASTARCLPKDLEGAISTPRQIQSPIYFTYHGEQFTYINGRLRKVCVLSTGTGVVRGNFMEPTGAWLNRTRDKP
jgi:hypothetical protein